MAKKKNEKIEEPESEIEYTEDLEDAMVEAENGDIDPMEELERELESNASPEDAEFITSEEPETVEDSPIKDSVVLVPVKVEINRKLMEDWFKWCGVMDGVMLHVGNDDAGEMIGMEVSNRMNVRKWMPCKNKGDSQGWLPLTGAHISFSKCLGITSGDNAVLDFDMKTVKITTEKENVSFDVDIQIVNGTYAAKKLFDKQIVYKGEMLFVCNHEYANKVIIKNTVLQSILSRWSKYGAKNLGLQIINGKAIARFVNDVKDVRSNAGASIEIDADITCNGDYILGFPDISAKTLEVISKESGFVEIHFFDGNFPFFIEAFFTSKDDTVNDKIQLMIAPLVDTDEYEADDEESDYDEHHE